MLVFVGGQTLFVEHMRQVLTVAVVVRVPTARMRRLRFVVKRLSCGHAGGTVLFFAPLVYVLLSINDQFCRQQQTNQESAPSRHAGLVTTTELPPHVITTLALGGLLAGSWPSIHLLSSTVFKSRGGPKCRGPGERPMRSPMRGKILISWNLFGLPQPRHRCYPSQVSLFTDTT